MTTITLTVTSFNGRPGDGSLSAQFDELGGLIGRADTNQMVLPDPDRSISRVHAQVVYRSSRYAIIDRGSNPILVNGQAAGNDREMPLSDGDKVQIGGYELVARLVEGAAARATPADPFADLLGAAPARAGSALGSALVDPLAAFSSPPPAAAAPRAPAAAPFAAPLGATPPPAAAGGIPDDWNPFAPEPAAPARAAPGPRGNALGLDLGAAAPPALIPDLAGSGSGGDSLDALFGLKPGGGGDPFAQSALAQPMAQPNMAANADPLKSLGSAARASSATQTDALSDLQRPFMSAPAARAASASAPIPAPAPAPALATALAPPAVERTLATPRPAPPADTDAAHMPGGAVLSWDSAPGDSHTVIRPGSTLSGPMVPKTTPPLPAAPPASSPAPAAAPRPAPAAVAGTDVQALHTAFREGLGVPELKFDALTPELMRLVGQLLREAASGTVDMLVARATLKRELRAESTMIVARENNPLKFSPTAEVALQHLLSPPARGFMAAAPAMRDAYADLRAHQFGMVAGMRAALEGVLERFDPVQLEGQLTERSVLHSLLPGSRKARMWEVFVEHYGQIREDASDDFQNLFGRAFLQAYEQHIDQIEGEGM